MDKNNSKKTAFSYFIYRLLHYTNYHSYKQALKRLRVYLVLIIVIALSTILMPLQLSSKIVNLTLVLMMGYFILYYVVTSKSNLIKRDSKSIMKKIALNGYISKAWHIYDGVYRINETDMSLELVFTEDKGLLIDLWEIFGSKKEPNLPLTENDLKTLKKYILNLALVEKQIDKQIIVYATLDNKLYSQLSELGIDLELIPQKYRSVPSRLEYKAAYKNKKIYSKYRRSAFKAYRLTIKSEHE
ncbi:hypothetical protein [Lactobacillus taiwanensis]|uniref:hypothetical protein n=1 Tax=Lactobacillus taiwanensis TaxID=508451 RepID=UPI00214C945C|nr:hypothetical protein [Lactobacillus taiwanensis]MCR1904023.1 hypothetical protein [Lactobacillus taiwanensis]